MCFLFRSFSVGVFEEIFSGVKLGFVLSLSFVEFLDGSFSKLIVWFFDSFYSEDIFVVFF